MTETLQEQLASSLANLEAAITAVAPATFDLAVRATFMSGLMHLLGGVFFCSAIITTVFILKHFVKSANDKEVDEMFQLITITVCALMSLGITLSIFGNLGALLDPVAYTTQELIRRGTN